MIRLLVLGLVFTLWSLAIAAPMDHMAQQKAIVFPKKIKMDGTGKTEEHKINPKDHKTTSHDKIDSTESATESSINSTLSTHVTFTIGEEYSVSPEQEHDSPMVSLILEDPDDDQEHDEPPEHEDPEEPQEPVHSSEPIPDAVPLPADATDGMIEYNLGNPLALKLHLPWWPLKDMLKSIQDAISVMNLTMDAESLDDDYTKTKTIQFDDRNYTLKVKVFKPHENNRLLVRLISLTPVIDDGKIPNEKGMKIDDEHDDKNDALEESLEKSFQMRKLDEKKDDDDDDDDSDDYIMHAVKKEEKTKGKDSKKEKLSKKKKEGKKEEGKKEEGKKGEGKKEEGKKEEGKKDGDAEKKSK